MSPTPVSANLSGLPPEQRERALALADKLKPEDRAAFFEQMEALSLDLQKTDARMNGALDGMDALAAGMQKSVRGMRKQDESQTHATDMRRADDLLA